jgi:CDP-diacylglycerol--serine O-phosphatidyltransferase
MNKPKPFSMIREFHLADWFTLANAFCGVGALFSVMTFLQTGDVRHIWFACWLIPAALVFDVLDGRVARWRQQSSELGRELDSLADVISFGVAPAAIAYGCGMQGLWDRIVLVFFVVCGVSRLARYNITAEKHSEGGDKVRFFEGTPIPTSLLLVVVLGSRCAEVPRLRDKVPSRPSVPSTNVTCSVKRNRVPSGSPMNSTVATDTEWCRPLRCMS